MIVVTGATGFTGGHVVDLLRGFPIRVMVRDLRALPPELKRPDVEAVVGDFNDRQSLVQAFTGCDTLLNVGSLGFGHAPNIVSAAEQAGTKRAVFISTTAIFTNLEANTKAVRLKAEETIRSSQLDWTILRPTMIYGTERDRNIYRLLRTLSRFPVFPVLGDGNRLQQPLYVKDLASAIVTCSQCPVTVKKAYNLAGKEPLSFNDLIRQAAEFLGKRVYIAHVPQRLVLPVLAFYNRVSRSPILRVEQVLRLNEDKAFPYDSATRDFGFGSRAFAAGVEEMVGNLRSKGLL